jgi:hypothetical protein
MSEQQERKMPFSELERAYRASLRAPKGTVTTDPLPDGSVIQAVIEKYLDTTAEGKSIFLSVDNLESISNYVIKGLALGWFTLSLTAVGAAHEYLLANGYLELSPDERYDPELKAVVRTRGSATRPAAQVYPRYIHPDNELQQRIETAKIDHAAWLADCKAKKKMKFSDLRKEVMKERRFPKPGEAGWGDL